MTFALVIHLALLALLVFLIVDMTRGYLAATGTVWQRLLAAGKGSATILWSRFSAGVTIFASGILWIAELLNASPGVQDAIRSGIRPEYAAGVIVIILAGAELARRRTLGK